MKDRNVRDRLWLWGHQAGSHNGKYNLPGQSDITPPDAARFMDIPNLLMVVYGGRPEPPFGACAQTMAGLKRVVWSVVGDSSSSRNNQQSDLEEVIALAREFPNLTGGILDDFFQQSDVEGACGRYDLATMRHFRDRLHAHGLDLSVVLYDHQLTLPARKFLELADVVTFWTWKATELVNLEANFARAESLVGNRRRMLGCYLWDYGSGGPVPIELMRHQCETGLRWLEQGRIEGMIFLPSCVCDLDIEAVHWTRRWIGEYGGRPLADSPGAA